jgi:hypothetical protein
MTMKKVIAITLTAAMALTLAACGGGATNNTVEMNVSNEIVSNDMETGGFDNAVETNAIDGNAAVAGNAM